MGGVPEKVEAARQAGIRRVFIPVDNDMESIHTEGMDIRPVSALQQVLAEMLLPVTVGVAESVPAGVQAELPVAAAPAEGRGTAVTAGTGS